MPCVKTGGALLGLVSKDEFDRKLAEVQKLEADVNTRAVVEQVHTQRDVPAIKAHANSLTDQLAELEKEGKSAQQKLVKGRLWTALGWTIVVAGAIVNAVAAALARWHF